MLSTRKAELADLLLELGAIKFGEFKLKLHETQPDAPLSPIFLNLRTPDNPKPGPLTEDALKMIGHLLWSEIQANNLIFDRIVGIPRAGEPLADSVAGTIQWNILRLGKVEADGRRQVTGVIDGTFFPGDRLLLIDDLITGAHSKLEAVETATSHGLICQDILVLVDRQQGGAAELAKRELRLFSVYSLAELLDYYAVSGRISRTQEDDVRRYIAENQA